MVDFSFIVSLYVSDLPNVTISTALYCTVLYCFFVRFRFTQCNSTALYEPAQVHDESPRHRRARLKNKQRRWLSVDDGLMVDTSVGPSAQVCAECAPADAERGSDLLGIYGSIDKHVVPHAKTTPGARDQTQPRLSVPEPSSRGCCCLIIVHPIIIIIIIKRCDRLPSGSEERRGQDEPS